MQVVLCAGGTVCRWYYVQVVLFASGGVIVTQ